MASGTSDTSVQDETPRVDGPLAAQGKQREQEVQSTSCSWFSVALHKIFSLFLLSFTCRLSYVCLKCYLGQSSVFHRTRCKV